MKPRSFIVLAAVAALSVGLTGCGADENTAVAGAAPTSPVAVSTTDSSGPVAAKVSGPGERLGSPEGNFIYGDSVAEWLKIGRVREAFSGTVVASEVGPAVTEVRFGKNDVINTALVQVRVDRVFAGTARVGDVVPVAMFAGSGTVVPLGDSIPTKVNASGTTAADFNSEFPAGTRVVSMSNPHPIGKMFGSSDGVTYPPGLAKKSEYSTGTHPQALTFEMTNGQMSDWNMTYAELIAALSGATFRQP